jgi:hypothetical protein
MREFVLTNVDQVPVIHDLLNQLPTWTGGIVALGPVFTQPVRFVLPGQETDRFDNGGLNDFTSSKDTPGQCVRAVVSVGPQLAVLSDGVVCQVIVIFDTSGELINQGRWNKEFQVGLLVNETVLGTPSVDRVRRLDTVDSGLGVDGQETSAIQVDQVILDVTGLGTDWTVTPGKSVQLALQKANKNIGEILDGLGLAPQLDVLLVGSLEPNTIRINLTKRRRSRIGPATVRVLVPCLCTGNI